jgi:hypothetical protein
MRWRLRSHREKLLTVINVDFSLRALFAECKSSFFFERQV